MSDGNIVAAKKQLDEAVQRLCFPNWKTYQNRLCEAPSLYDQLRSDLAGTQGDTRTPAKSLPPVHIDALELLKDIDGKARTWTGRNGNTTPDRLFMLINKHFRPQDTQQVTEMATTVDRWCETICNLLDPRSQLHISAPCPSCGKSVIYRRDSGGDLVREEALKWTPIAGFECQACKASWSPLQTLFFARLLGIELPEGVLE